MNNKVKEVYLYTRVGVAVHLDSNEIRYNINVKGIKEDSKIILGVLYQGYSAEMVEISISKIKNEGPQFRAPTLCQEALAVIEQLKYSEIDKLEIVFDDDTRRTISTYVGNKDSHEHADTQSEFILTINSK